MKRSIFITLGILVVLIVLGVWVYLMFFGVPKSPGEVWKNIGFQLNHQATTVAPPSTSTSTSSSTVPTQPVVNTKVKFRQLTTRPVAGYYIVTTNSSSTSSSTTSGGTTAVDFVEEGTGHIYQIDLATGVETMISRTTIPTVAKAYFSPSGTAVAELSYTPNGGTQVVVGNIVNSALNSISLEPNARNISFLDDHTVLYTVSQNGTTIGYQQDLEAQQRTERFRFNFSSLDVDWGHGLDKTYLTTKPTRDLEGFAYSITNNTPTPVAPIEYGLSILPLNGAVLMTYSTPNGYKSGYTTDGLNISPISGLLMKEKCVSIPEHPMNLWCAVPPSYNVTKTYVEDWYKGLIQSWDQVNYVNLANNSVAEKDDPNTYIGHSLDMINLETDSTGHLLFFKNKTDQTLWEYNSTVQ